jgi:hypothetical protein
MIECGSSPDFGIMSSMLGDDRDPHLLQLSELRWIVFARDPDVTAQLTITTSKDEVIAEYNKMRQLHRIGQTPTLRSTISLGGDHVPVPLGEFDIGERTLARIVAVCDHLAQHSAGSGDHISTANVMSRGEIIDIPNEGEPLAASGDHVPVLAATARVDNVSATVPLAYDEGVEPKPGDSAPEAAGGDHVSVAEMEGADILDLPVLVLRPRKDDGDHVSEPSDGGDEDDDRDVSEDIVAELAQLRMRISSMIQDKAIRTISLNIATEPVLINHPPRKSILCPNMHVAQWSLM